MIDIIVNELIEIKCFIIDRWGWSFLAIFWPFLFIELPRYVLTDIIVLIRALRTKSEDKD